MTLKMFPNFIKIKIKTGNDKKEINSDARTKKLVNGEEKTAYHIISRTALDGFPFDDVEKNERDKTGIFPVL